jgi:hypothetical protein
VKTEREHALCLRCGGSLRDRVRAWREPVPEPLPLATSGAADLPWPLTTRALEHIELDHRTDRILEVLRSRPEYRWADVVAFSTWATKLRSTFVHDVVWLAAVREPFNPRERARPSQALVARRTRCVEASPYADARGFSMKAESIRCLDGHRDDRRTPRAQPPDVELHLDAEFKTDPMRIALVGGVHPDENCRQWTVVARNGAPTSVLKAARLYPFTSAGKDAALDGARGLEVRLGGKDGWTRFVARVLVEGPWHRPVAVTPAWVVEGREQPVAVDYYFD